LVEKGRKPSRRQTVWRPFPIGVGSMSKSLKNRSHSFHVGD
jgi:hypothetical protein